MPTFKRRDQEEMEKAKDLLEAAPSAEMGFVKNLFFGRLKLDAVLPYPKQDPEEVRRADELIAKLDAFLKTEVDPDKIDAEERIPQNVIDGLGKLGVLGMTVPKEYGGGGFQQTSYCRVLEHISRYCGSTAVLVGAHQSIGLKAVVLMGNEKQKAEYLPHLATGKKLAAFCLSEPEVGSDAANVQTTAHLSADGSHYILNGHKKFATNAALAGMMTVMAKTPVKDEATGKTKDKITAFIVTPDLPGFHVVSPNRSKCGIRGTWQGTLKFTDMRVPAENVLGHVGKGLKVALSVLDYGRCTMSAGCVGGSKQLLEMCVAHAKKRHQFSRPIGEFHLIKQKLGRMAQNIFAMEALTYLAAGMVDRDDGDLMLETAIVKLFCSEANWQSADDALQIFGGEGYIRENGVERMMRDSRINRIVEGATEVMTSFVALVGMKGVGEEFESVLRASRHPIDNFGRLAKFAQSQWSDIVMGKGAKPARDGRLHRDLQEEGRILSNLTVRLARSVHKLLRTYKQDILDMQLLQERVAWSAVDMFAMSAVISKMQSLLEERDKHSGNGNSNGNGNGNGHHGNGHEDVMKRDLLLGKAFCRRAAANVVDRLEKLFDNVDKDLIAAADAVMGKKE